MNELVENFKLTMNEVNQFEKNGFIGPFTIYSPEEIDELWDTVRRQIPDRSYAAYPIDSLGGVTNISNYDRHLDIDKLAEHICNRKIVERVKSILGNNVLCWRTEFFPKYPGDEGTDWHQADTFANASGKPQILWPGENDDNFNGGTLTVWTAFTDSNKENGCLQLIPGSHKKMNYDERKTMKYRPDSINATNKDGLSRGFFGYDYRDLKIDPEWKPEESKAYPVVMQRGQCLIFWSTLMHASLPNINTDRRKYRMGFATRYVPSSVTVYPNTDVVEEYGGKIPLDNFGNVLVGGQDMSGGVNKYHEATLKGTPFIVK